MRLSYLLLFLCFTLFTTAQNFEGYISYNVEVESTTPEMPKNLLQQWFGTKFTVFFKDGGYVGLGDGTFMIYELFRPGDSLQYFKDGDSDSILYYKSLNVPEARATFTMKETADTILGYPCTLLTVDYGDRLGKYYFNKSLGIDTSAYTHFLIFNKREIVSRMESVYLKFEMEYPYGKAILTATEIHPLPLKESIFDFPKNTPIMPYPEE